MGHFVAIIRSGGSTLVERDCSKSGLIWADALEPFHGSEVAIGGAIGPLNGPKRPKLGHFVAITTSGGSKLVELCGTRLQQVRANLGPNDQK